MDAGASQKELTLSSPVPVNPSTWSIILPTTLVLLHLRWKRIQRYLLWKRSRLRPNQSPIHFQIPLRSSPPKNLCQQEHQMQELLETPNDHQERPKIQLRQGHLRM